MIELSAYAERVIDRISMVGMWLAVTICVRNFTVCLRQYRRSHGLMYSNHDDVNSKNNFSNLCFFSHLMNMVQVFVLFIHRFIYGIIPLFEITTCVFWPLLVS